MGSPKPTAIKICGITDTNQAKHIASLGADAIGVIGVEKSPRHLTDVKRRILFSELKNFSQELELVLVIADFSDSEITNVLKGDGSPSIIQLHGNESPNRCNELRKRYPNCQWWKAIRVHSALEINKAHQYEEHVDALLLDAWSPQFLGGTGQRVSLELLKEENFACPWWLAGGISAEWIPQILKHEIKPFGFDASSRLETSPGIKDLEKVQELIKSVKKIN